MSRSNLVDGLHGSLLLRCRLANVEGYISEWSGPVRFGLGPSGRWLTNLDEVPIEPGHGEWTIVVTGRCDEPTTYLWENKLDRPILTTLSDRIRFGEGSIIMNFSDHHPSGGRGASPDSPTPSGEAGMSGPTTTHRFQMPDGRWIVVHDAIVRDITVEQETHDISTFGSTLVTQVNGDAIVTITLVSRSCEIGPGIEATRQPPEAPPPKRKAVKIQ